MMRTTISATISFLMVVCFFTTVIAGEVSRLVPTDKVTVFKDGEKIAEYTKEMPVPESVVLSCNGKCGIKLDDISIVGEDQSRFLIDSEKNNRYLGVEKGIVYFGISTMPRKIVFMTPKGAVSANQVFIEASSNNRMVEGYIKVSDDISEIGVIDGGSLQLLTNDGQQLLKPGERFILAQANIGAGASDEVVVGTFTTQGGFFENLTSGQIALGTTVAIAGGVSSIGAILHDKDSSTPASPFQPQNP
jgi:hypothetical protein